MPTADEVVTAAVDHATRLEHANQLLSGITTALRRLEECEQMVIAEAIYSVDVDIAPPGLIVAVNDLRIARAAHKATLRP